MKSSDKKSIFLNVLGIIVLSGIFSCAFITIYGFASTCKGDKSGEVPSDKKSDTLIVLGNKVYPDGTMSPVLKSRVDAALDAYRAGCAPHIIVSGGFGKEGWYEAEVMSAYLIAQGVPSPSITIDNYGINSHETAINAKRIMAEKGFASATIVTSYYHVLRSELALRQVGIDSVDGIGSRYIAFKDILGIPRDLAGIFTYLILY